MIKKIGFLFDKNQKIRLAILTILILIGMVVECVGVTAIMPLISVITDESVIRSEYIYILLGKQFNINSQKQYVFVLSILLIIIYLFKNSYLIIEYYLQYKFIYNNQSRLSEKVFRSYVNEDYIFYVEKNVAELQRNTINDIQQFYMVVLAFIQFLTESTVCMALVIYLAVCDWMVTLIIAGIIIVFYLGFVLFTKSYSVKLGSMRREEFFLQYKCLLQAFGGIKDVKVTGTENYFINQFKKTSINIARLDRKTSMLNIVPRPIMESLCICGLLFVVAIRVSFGMNMSKMVPVLSVFAVATFRMLPAFNRISGYVQTMFLGKSAVDSLYQDIIDIENKHNITDNEIPHTISINNGISVRNVSFRYPNSDCCVLDNISLEIPKNNAVAFIGTSGAGKTTLADVILGILKPEMGSVFVDNIDVFENKKSWHSIIGYIPQTIFLVDDSIRCNVAFGVPNTEIDDEQVWTVLEQAQIADYIRTLPNGINTEVGERGVKLSGGQRQRIGIARALYNNPEVLILDEATSALDNDTEEAVMSAIDSLHGSRTMIIIAHRLTTIRNCDIIYEISDGKAKIKNRDLILSDKTN